MTSSPAASTAANEARRIAPPAIGPNDAVRGSRSVLPEPSREQKDAVDRHDIAGRIAIAGRIGHEREQGWQDDAGWMAGVRAPAQDGAEAGSCEPGDPTGLQVMGGYAAEVNAPTVPPSVDRPPAPLGGVCDGLLLARAPIWT